MCSLGGAGFNQRCAEARVGTDGADNDSRDGSESPHIVSTTAVRDDRRQVRRADCFLYLVEFCLRSSGNCPRQLYVILVQILRNQRSGKPGGTVDDDVEVSVCIFTHTKVVKFAFVHNAPTLDIAV